LRMPTRRGPAEYPMLGAHLYARMVDVEPTLETKLGKLCNADCLDVMPLLGKGNIDLIFANPPFNLGKDYGNGVSDSLKDHEYLRWCERWIAEGVRVLTPGGAYFLWNLPRCNIELGRYLNEVGMIFRHWVAVDIK
jgi:site-specific DNA-methyltransferase (adenine-specific)